MDVGPICIMDRTQGVEIHSEQAFSFSNFCQKLMYKLSKDPQFSKAVQMQSAEVKEKPKR